MTTSPEFTPVEREVVAREQPRELKERVVEINRVAKVVKGGRRFSFTALVVVGDENSVVGVGYGKANEVPVAIQKGVEAAKKNLFRVPKHGSTITHETLGIYGSGGRTLRISAAVWPTCCLSVPLTVIVVGVGTSKLMPVRGLIVTGCE